jgi:hypothetical protein
MSSMKRLEKRSAGWIIATAMFVAVTVGFVLLRDTSAPVSATPPAEAEQRAAGQTSIEPVVLYQSPDDPPPAEQIVASETPSSEPTPEVRAIMPPDSEVAMPSATQQRVFKSRRAMETIDPRQFRR